jgi:hypothetical protein
MGLTRRTDASIAARDVDTGDHALSAVLFRGLTIEGTVVDVGERRGSIQVQLTLRVDVSPTRPEPLTLVEAVAAYPEGALVEAVVDKVRDDLGRAWFVLPGGLQATVSAADIGSAGVLSIGDALTPGDTVLGRVRRITDRNGVLQVQLEAKYLPTPSIWEQLEAAGIRTGALVDGRVANVNDTLGVFVELRPGLNGLVHRSKLSGPLTAFKRGDPCRVRITRVAEDRNKPGRPNVQLELA